jgi:hypothetical protein
MITALLRAGPAAAIQYAHIELNGKDLDKFNLENTLLLSGLKLREKNEKAMELHYELKDVEYPNIVTTVKLTYDRSTFLPLSRTVASITGDGIRTTCSETYLEIKLDPDIPDEKFKLPEEKK